MKDIPKYFPSTIPDRAITLLCGVSDLVDLIIQLELELPCRLDVERLAKSVDLALDAEPVLGCRWIPHWRKPRWERLDSSERRSFLLAEGQDDYEAFRCKRIDASIGPQIQACLWQSPDGDNLLLKVAHDIADAGGVKEIVSVVSSIYARLVHQPNYQPEPNTKGSRGIWQVLRHIPPYAYPGIYLDYLRQLRSTGRAPNGTCTLPTTDGPCEPLEFVYRFIPADRVSYLAKYGKAHDATLNDLLLAAYLRALRLRGNWDGKARFMVGTTVGLRQWYLPNKRGEGICNLSGTEYLHFGTDIGSDFAATLQRVCVVTSRRKMRWIGLASWVVGLPYLQIVPHNWMTGYYRTAVQRAIAKNNTAPAFTNMGLIDPESVTFDDKPSNARLLPPPVRPPLFAVGLSGYSGALTISAGVYPTQKDATERFFDTVVSELPS